MSTNTKKVIVFQHYGDGNRFTHITTTCDQEIIKEYDYKSLGGKACFSIANIIVDNEDNLCDKMEIFLPYYGDGLFLTWNDQRKQWDDKFR